MLQEVITFLRGTPSGRRLLEEAEQSRSVARVLSLTEQRRIELEIERDTIRALPPTHRKAQSERLNTLRAAAVLAGKKGWARVGEAEALVAKKQEELARARQAAYTANAERSAEDQRLSREIEAIERELEIGTPEPIEQFMAYVLEQWHSLTGLRPRDWTEAEYEEETRGFFSAGWLRKDKRFTSRHARQRALGDLQATLLEAKALALSGEAEPALKTQLDKLRARVTQAIASVGGEEVAA